MGGPAAPPAGPDRRERGADGPDRIDPGAARTARADHADAADLACAIGIASVLFDVTWMSFVPTVVKDPKHYVEANQKLAVTSSARTSPARHRRSLIAALTAPTALIVDAFSYLASLATLTLVRTPEPSRRRRRRRRRIPPKSATACVSSSGTRSCGRSPWSRRSATSPWSSSGRCSCSTPRGPRSSARC